ncbi:MAG: hypothetical protein ACI86H_001264, partial [bacterium]
MWRWNLFGFDFFWGWEFVSSEFNPLGFRKSGEKIR